VLEAGRDERRDRRDDGEDPVGRRAGAVREPDREADERVAERAEGDRLDEAQPDLRLRDRERLLADGAVAERVLPPHVHERSGRDRADEVPRVDDRPAAEQPSRRDAPARPGHDDEVVAGEELGARHDDEDEPEGERDSSEQALHAERQVAASRHDRGREQRPERDERAGENREGEERGRLQRGLGDADVLGPPRHRGGRQRVKARGREGRLLERLRVGGAYAAHRATLARSRRFGSLDARIDSSHGTSLWIGRHGPGTRPSPCVRRTRIS
jgi:hypothetical protein